MKQNSLSPVPF